MPGALEPRHDETPSLATYLANRRTMRAFGNLEDRTLMRLANVRAEGRVATEKLHEFDFVTREAMTGTAFLHHMRGTLAANNPFLDDELKFVTDVARLMKLELLGDLQATYCRESRS